MKVEIADVYEPAFDMSTPKCCKNLWYAPRACGKSSALGRILWLYYINFPDYDVAIGVDSLTNAGDGVLSEFQSFLESENLADDWIFSAKSCYMKGARNQIRSYAVQTNKLDNVNATKSKEIVEKYIEQPYSTPEMFGVKMQMDVKVVPRECKTGVFKTEKEYQYTIIDEATRERFIYPYKEQSTFSTVDFLKRAFVYFGYLPAIVQTDNGTEFTTPKIAKPGTVCLVDKFLAKYGIKHQLIRPRTPRHNGKVERSHRTDQECFYNHLKYSSYEELQEKMADWLNRYNNRPHSSLRNSAGKRVWLTPLQKRTELLAQYKAVGFKNENDEEYSIRFLKKAA